MEEHRRRTFGFLALLSSDKAMSALSERLDPERLAFEMCRAWFDKIYVPSETYLDGLRGDRSAEAVERFMAAFDDEENAALARFHRFFELRMKMVGKHSLGEGRIPLGDSWLALTRDAAYLLDALECDVEAIRQDVTDCLAPAHSARKDPDADEPEGMLDLILLERPRPDRPQRRPRER